jgi:acetyltransferase-like isoleucine patch superfamily enzyme
MKLLFDSYFSFKCIIIRISNFKISIFSLFDTTTSIHKTSRISRFSVLRNTIIESYTFLASNSDLVNCKIGSFCSISKNVTIGAATHPTNFISTSPIFYRERNALKSKWVNGLLFADESLMTDIGNDVWIGMNATIMGGLKIGNGAIIAAHSVVTNDIPPYAIVAGVPARIIKYRFGDNQIQKIDKLKWWRLSPVILKNNCALFSKVLDNEIIDELSLISDE